MQSSPYDIDPSYIDTAARMIFSIAILIDDIIADDYETIIVADKIFKMDHLATITAIKSMIIKLETTITNSLTKNYSVIVFQNSIEKLYWKHF